MTNASTRRVAGIWCQLFICIALAAPLGAQTETLCETGRIVRERSEPG